MVWHTQLVSVGAGWHTQLVPAGTILSQNGYGSELKQKIIIYWPAHKQQALLLI
jgi:hypothetical protein